MRKFLLAFAVFALPLAVSAQVAPPATTTAVSTLASTTISSYGAVTGITGDEIFAWTTSNITLFIGTAIVTLVELKYWIAAILVIVLILSLVLRAFQFFRH